MERHTSHGAASGGLPLEHGWCRTLAVERGVVSFSIKPCDKVDEAMGVRDVGRSPAEVHTPRGGRLRGVRGGVKDGRVDPVKRASQKMMCPVKGCGKLDIFYSFAEFG